MQNEKMIDALRVVLDFAEHKNIGGDYDREVAEAMNTLETYLNTFA